MNTELGTLQEHYARLKEKYKTVRDQAEQQTARAAQLEREGSHHSHISVKHRELMERFKHMREDYLLLQESQGNLADIIGEMALRNERLREEKQQAELAALQLREAAEDLTPPCSFAGMYEALGVEMPVRSSKEHVAALILCLQQKLQGGDSE